MFAKRPYRLATRFMKHVTLAKEIKMMDYHAEDGYCQGASIIYADAKLRGKGASFKEWIVSLSKTPHLAKNFERISEKKEQGEALSKEDTAFLDKFPGDPRTFLDSLVLAQAPELDAHRPFLLSECQSQLDIENIFKAIKDKDNGRIVKIFHDAVIKTQHEMQEYITHLITLLKPKEQEIDISNSYVILFSSCDHMIATTPNLVTNQLELFDINQLPFVDFPLNKAAAEIRQAFTIQEESRNSSQAIKRILKALIFEKLTACSVLVLTTNLNPEINETASKLRTYKANQKITFEIATRKTRNNSTLAHIAAQHGLTDILKKLGNCGANFNIARADGKAPLFYAIKNNQLSSVKIILQYGADISAKASSELPPFFAAVAGNKEIILYILNEYAEIKSQFIDTETKEGWTALSFAIALRKTDIVKILLQNGANPLQVDQNKKTLLMLACEFGNEIVVELLIEKLSSIGRPDILDEKDKDGLTCAMYAVRNGHDQILKILAKYGANFHTRDLEKSPLAHAIMFSEEHPNTLEILAEYKELNTPLLLKNNEYYLSHFAVELRKLPVIRHFAEKGVDFTQATDAATGSAIKLAITMRQWDLAARMLMATDELAISPHDLLLLNKHKEEIMDAYENEKKIPPLEKDGNPLKTEREILEFVGIRLGHDF